MKEVNELGEPPGRGPEWACDAYGQPGHDYCKCSQCMERFQTYLAAKASYVALAAA